MLDAMRRGAQTPVAKLLFGLLCVSFAIWGVADVFQGWGRGFVAKVGHTEISAEEFRRSYQNELDRISRQSNQRLSAEQGHAFGLDRQVLAQMIAGAAIEAHADQLGLAISDKTLAEGIQADPNFQTDGKFNRQGFEGLLQQIGMSEQGFLNLRRKDELRGAIVSALIKGQTVPKPLLDEIHAYNQEKRVLEWVKIDPAAVTVAEPDEATLKKRYEDDKAKYMTPEYRKVQVLMLTPDDLKKSITITDDEIAKAYEADKDSFNTPEQRRVQQIAFKDRATAETALKALRDGTKSLADVAKETGAKDTDVDLGLITKKSLIDPKVADVAFSLEKDKYSDVIDGRFATVVVRVTQIEPGTTKTLADVKEQVRDKLANDKVHGNLQSKRDDVEDARLAGKTLKEVADQLQLTYKEIPATDVTGLGPDGKPVLETADIRKITARAFAPDTGDDSAIDLTNDGYAWVNVLSTDAPKQKAYDEVKDAVKQDYMSSEHHRLLDELAKKLTDKVNAGEPIASIEAEAKGKVEKTEPITRKTIPPSISQSMVAQAFALAKGKAGHGPSSDNTTEIVFRVAEVTPAAALTLTETDELTRRLEDELANQSLTEYTEALKKRFGASVNQAELKSAVGVTQE
ncbi:PpiC-type peptidyl-prolyl cis-trans isomerase [Hyphomicrobium denitrificans ATCC 51888]|uniref:Parvulin-like PPIase n=1 Tax=Hyphomicrobium denitrificans (strain ATCC 51888 / DSM 1869 / NCIMB 11706 / TK 0415) TaxID=582899 RepID=D8JXC3_HYPDA|nr:SurA N-terminal domain-containing protein [Hyphomicrobium denitrificans]ADJ23259.1 PpiC-type peptidyl-prolyl cis-trans isomerase [Hyphomicrobium denitrificans ATCC 51888]